jgi:HD superfamily phosphohydrolase YqeK
MDTGTPYVIATCAMCNRADKCHAHSLLCFECTAKLENKDSDEESLEHVELAALVHDWIKFQEPNKKQALKSLLTTAAALIVESNLDQAYAVNFLTVTIRKFIEANKDG